MAPLWTGAPKILTFQLEPMPLSSQPQRPACVAAPSALSSSSQRVSVPHWLGRCDSHPHVCCQTQSLPARRWSFGILMYELVYGFTPFRGAKRDQTFENILKRPLVFPPKPEISKPCQVTDSCLSHCQHGGWTTADWHTTILRGRLPCYDASGVFPPDVHLPGSGLCLAQTRGGWGGAHPR